MKSGKPRTAQQIQGEYNRQAEALPTETKRKFMQAMRDGKNIGEAREAAGIDEVMVAAALFLQCFNMVPVMKSQDEII